MMNMVPATPEAFRLLHEGAIALAEVECNGMGVNVDYIRLALKEQNKRIKELVAEKLETSDVMKVWRKSFRDVNIDSDTQLGIVLFEKMGFKPPRETAGGRYAADAEALKTVDHPFVADYLDIKKLKKAVNTNLVGILREVVDGRIHCFFNLHSTKTYRSSSDSFNFQNLPIRDPVIALLIRSCFIPSDGNQIVEIDFSGAEVRVGECYHHDPTMKAYILDESKDMHRDTAREIFMIPEKQGVVKFVRNTVKGAFVFAEFYGDYYINCAPNMWKIINDPNAKLEDGTPLRKHMAAMGVTTLGALDTKQKPAANSFEKVVKDVENSFWNERFPVYAQWKKEWFAEYAEKGYFETHTGFVCRGYMTKNEAINSPVQGSAFHCLLWALIRIVRVELPRRGMKTKVVGQIHDSMVADVVPAERDEFLRMCRKVMTKLLARHYPWLTVPMAIEADVSPVGGSWADKKEWDIDACDWKKKG